MWPSPSKRVVFSSDKQTGLNADKDVNEFKDCLYFFEILKSMFILFIWIGRQKLAYFSAFEKYFQIEFSSCLVLYVTVPREALKYRKKCPALGPIFSD